MKSKTKFKCLHCREEHKCDPRNRGRQCYCQKAECRKASKVASQKRWTGKPENENYFCGAENVDRVRQWRKEHPGYWRKKRAGREDALQETCNAQDTEGELFAEATFLDTLQDICRPQPALLVGLIAILTGHALQEDIAASARSFLTRGEDILRMVRGGPQNPSHENQTHSVSAATAARAAPI
jgi:hypothetical protein